MTLLYYVYAYINSKTGLPYYIGKGKGPRAYSPHKHINLPRDSSLIVFLARDLTNVGALALESRYIRWYGRKGLDEGGILLNRSTGGESGPVGVKFSAETNKAKGRSRSRPEHGAKIRQAWLDGRMPQLGVSRPHTEETLKKLRKPKRDKTNYQGKRWYHSPSLELEACLGQPPDWPDAMLGRLKRSCSK